jgi:alpha-glucosidase
MRWTMAGAFLPWFRNHYIRKGSKDFQEPYAYASVDVSQVQPPEARPLYGMVAAVCKLYIQRRYRMLQLFYDAMFENTLNGLPICRSMILTDSVDKTLYNDKADFLGNQFLLRGDLLIAPVLEPQSQDNLFGSRDVYLPAGSEWYCYMDNTLPLAGAIEGGTTIRGFNAGLTTDGNHMQFLLPTYVRAGAILPLLDAENYVGERKSAGQPSPLTFNIYPGAGGSYTLYLDDGVSRSSAPLRGATPADNVANGGDPDAKAEYREVLISHQYLQDGSHEVRFHRVSDNYTPMETFFYVAILHETRDVAPPGDITSGGLKLPYLTGGSPETRAASLSQSAVNAWYYNETIRITFLKIFDQPADIVFSLL